ncbi:hypothetical protein RA27_15695 [Ruegeria sp. ANG-R]|nr:hypothetical protein RA27_15695 [Ruegeria sp. ANG-R]
MFENRLRLDGRSALGLGFSDDLGPVEKLECHAQPGFRVRPIFGVVLRCTMMIFAHTRQTNRFGEVCPCV